MPKSSPASKQKPASTIKKKQDPKKENKKPTKQEKDGAFLKEAGPVLGPVLLKLLRDPKKPPFNNAFLEDGVWQVPPGGVANYPECEPDADNETIKETFKFSDRYSLKYADGEWKVKTNKKLKRLLPLWSYGQICSRHHLMAGLSGNFTTYTIDNGDETDYDEEKLIVLHEQADLIASDWSKKDFYCYH